MKQGQVRIIGGEWRGRRLKVPDVLNLRPTPDRVRETVFNWLAPHIVGAYCLDAFAGSGVLGFEALSRGAKHVVMIDEAAAIVQTLQTELASFNADNADIYCATIPQGLRTPNKPFDIVFLDPPYASNLLLPVCFYLEEHRLLAHEALIYLEAASIIDNVDLPSNWEIIRSKQAGNVFYHLAKRMRITNE